MFASFTSNDNMRVEVCSNDNSCYRILIFKFNILGTLHIPTCIWHTSSLFSYTFVVLIDLFDTYLNERIEDPKIKEMAHWNINYNTTCVCVCV